MSVTNVLQERIRALQIRLGDPTLDDVRALGVTKTEVRKYMKDRGWYSSERDTGDARRNAWSDGPVVWLHDDPPQVLDTYDALQMICDIAKLEGRSPWDVLTDCDHHGRDLYHNGEIVGHERLGKIYHREQRDSDYYP